MWHCYSSNSLLWLHKLANIHWITFWGYHHKTVPTLQKKKILKFIQDVPFIFSFSLFSTNQMNSNYGMHRMGKAEQLRFFSPVRQRSKVSIDAISLFYDAAICCFLRCRTSTHFCDLSLLESTPKKPCIFRGSVIYDDNLLIIARTFRPNDVVIRKLI